MMDGEVVRRVFGGSGGARTEAVDLEKVRGLALVEARRGVRKARDPKTTALAFRNATFAEATARERGKATALQLAQATGRALGEASRSNARPMPLIAEPIHEPFQ
ncbi:MAG: hypothetical protein JO372_07875 [Solirubrobacterales bacterium]|nr:hypothetical protein [Solirubrobacterales bacterium]